MQCRQVTLPINNQFQNIKQENICVYLNFETDVYKKTPSYFGFTMIETIHDITETRASSYNMYINQQGAQNSCN